MRNLFPFGNSTHSLINRSISSVSNAHITTVTTDFLSTRIASEFTYGPRSSGFSYCISSEATEKLVEPRGIEPRSVACKAAVLPLYRWPHNEMPNFSSTIKDTVLLPPLVLTTERMGHGEAYASIFFVAVCISNWLRDTEVESGISQLMKLEWFLVSVPLSRSPFPKNTFTIYS